MQLLHGYRRCLSVSQLVCGDLPYLLDAERAMPIAHCLAAAGGAEAYQRAMSAASMVEELHVELRSMLSNYRFAEAVRSTVQHTFRAAAAQVYAGIPASGDAAQKQSSPSSTSYSSPGPSQQAVAGNADLEISSNCNSDVSGFSSAAEKGQAVSPCSMGQPAPEEVSGSHAVLPMHRDRSGVWGAIPRAQQALGPAAVKPTRPMARMLKAVQSASDLIFVNIRQITRGIAGLPAVMGLCATAFACSAPA